MSTPVRGQPGPVVGFHKTHIRVRGVRGALSAVGLSGSGLEWGGIFLLAAFRCDGPAVQVPSLSQFVVFSFAGPAVFGGVFG